MFLWSKSLQNAPSTKKKTSVAIVSPYASQVTAMQERVRSYENHDFLSVKYALLIHVKAMRRTYQSFQQLDAIMVGIYAFSIMIRELMWP